jgi:hypothetical protein
MSNAAGPLICRSCGNSGLTMLGDFCGCKFGRRARLASITIQGIPGGDEVNANFSNMAALHTIIAGGQVTPTKEQYEPSAGIGFRGFLLMSLQVPAIAVDGDAILRIEAEIARLDRLYGITDEGNGAE